MEVDWYAALGVERPAEGENEQEVAEPAAAEEQAKTEDEGGNEQEAAEPAAEGNAEEDAPEGGDDGAQQRHAAAEQRRQQQRETIKQQLREEMENKYKQQLQSVLASVGLKKADGTEVSSFEEWEAYAAEQADAKLSRELKAGKLSEDSLRRALLKDPEIAKIVENARAAEQAAKNTQWEQAREKEMAEIRKIDPSVQSIDDIIAGDHGVEFARYIQAGFKADDAYKLATYDSAMQRARSAGQQAARNAAAGKSHMVSTPTGGKPTAVVPQKVAQWYKSLNPGMTDKEIQQAYERDYK